MSVDLSVVTTDDTVCRAALAGCSHNFARLSMSPGVQNGASLAVVPTNATLE